MKPIDHSILLWSLHKRRYNYDLCTSMYCTPFQKEYIQTEKNFGSVKCTTNPLSKLITSKLAAVKDGLQSSYNSCFFHGGVNSLWTLEDLLETFDFSTLYTTIPHTQLFVVTLKGWNP